MTKKVLAILAAFVLGTGLFAQEAEAAAESSQVATVQSVTETVAAAILELNGSLFGVWFLIGAALVFWMQAGFAMVEAGFTRAKNTGNIIMKNLMDFCIDSNVVPYWCLNDAFLYRSSNR